MIEDWYLGTPGPSSPTGPSATPREGFVSGGPLWAALATLLLTGGRPLGCEQDSSKSGLTHMARLQLLGLEGRQAVPWSGRLC